MQPASLEILEKSALPPAQARAIVQAIEFEIAGAKDTLATKQGTLVLRHETTAMGGELRHEMAELRWELRHDMAELRSELKADIAELRRDVGEMLSRSEFQAAMTSHTRHMYGAITGSVMGQFALLLGLAYFFVSHLQR